MARRVLVLVLANIVAANEEGFETALLPFVFGASLEVPVQGSKRCGQVCLLCLVTLLFAKDRQSSFLHFFFSVLSVSLPLFLFLFCVCQVKW